jgi:UDPglucose 6-dehydrogenase
LKIGIVGVGMVGGTLKFGFERLGHDVRCYDVAVQRTKLSDVLDTDLAFICVPTPGRPDGSCDTSIVENSVTALHGLGYQGHIVVKSTVTPGTTNKLIGCLGRHVAFCPEFLRERTAVADFCDYHDVCIIGTNTGEQFDLVKAAHGHYPRRFERMTPTEAELAKYFANTLNALKITFANQFYDVCKDLGADYAAIHRAVSHRSNVGWHYLECNERLRAYAGNCLPKDVKAFRHYVRTQTDVDPTLWAIIDSLNETKAKADEASAA